MDINKLINMFAKLPNLGSSSSRRIVLYLLRNREEIMLPLASSIQELALKTKECSICFNIDVKSPCSICSDVKRDQKLLCIVEELGDLWAFEKGKIYQGVYHVLGGTLSAIYGIGPDQLNFNNIIARIQNSGVQEVIIGISNTMDGQVTTHYITQMIKKLGVKVTRLACGIPMGGEIDYLDEGTLSAALSSRYVIS
ncbi:recombination protein RecR [Ehrlichia ruminantium]|uniref:Recombination protein RecR n=1 Tax=Ehrlichia ruminantium (strain Welgevonden) TaxID=254945 RepID=A0A0H3LYZ1_EHRRW|nr:recombination mediator RecR [Ehrlichia ruminantium]QLK50335.1 recombination protein RecR [Ehrlichia ruminantium]QLK51259.1 recombination protein RecR [Ehrlichia ruminantium]QLK52184.1 recombination protein RecR [Ehrlichia ruminantium]QLK54015.1 recombination protein RecR [Ehrlichia ruminantium]QLK54932.1 recombination protein RecR [Ehrlichia ruminantium]